jgi:excisionase family DNA binding protein
VPTKMQRAPPDVIDPEAVFTYAEAAEVLKVSERQVRRWVSERTIGSVQYPRGRRLLGRQLAEFLSGRVVDPEDEV